MRRKILIICVLIVTAALLIWVLVAYFIRVESRKVKLLMHDALLSGIKAAENYGPWQKVMNSNNGKVYLQLYIEDVRTQEIADKQTLWYIFSSKSRSIPVMRVTQFEFSRVPSSHGFATVQMGAEAEWIGPFGAVETISVYVNVDTEQSAHKHRI